MRVPVSEPRGTSPVMIVGLAFLLAVIALLAFRTSPQPGRIADWWQPNAAVAPNATPALVDAALPPIPARVGIQVGHWESGKLPDELAVLRTQGGANAGGYAEVDINYAVANLVAAQLRTRGITVDILPATIPAGYQADAFVALHCDANNDTGISGFKLARYADSAMPTQDDALLNAIVATYGPATGQRRDDLVTRAMLYYYAFNSHDFAHAINPKTPAVIIEMGFLTNPADRTLLVTQQPILAKGVADGIVKFLLKQ